MDALEAHGKTRELEERMLRHLDALGRTTKKAEFGPLDVAAFDGRWLAVARTHIEQAAMAMNRAVFPHVRSALPEDDQ